MPLGPGVQGVLEAACQTLPIGAAVVEIGSQDGHSASAIWKQIGGRGGRLFCVDPMRGDFEYFSSGAENTKGARNCDRIRKFFTNGLDHDGVILIVARSEDVAPFFSNGTLDLVFIDGDHRYEFVRKDIKLWWPKLKPSGLMCGDDYEGPEFDEKYIGDDYVNYIHHGVCKAVTERFGNVGVSGNRAWMVRKRMAYERGITSGWRT